MDIDTHMLPIYFRMAIVVIHQPISHPTSHKESHDGGVAEKTASFFANKPDFRKNV